jgi:hypothetical protein
MHRRRRGVIPICRDLVEADAGPARAARRAGEQTVLHGAEAADVEKNALASALKNVAATSPTSGEFNEVWLESEKGRSSKPEHVAVIDPADGKIPYTAEGRARWAATPNLRPSA